MRLPRNSPLRVPAGVLLGIMLGALGWALLLELALTVRRVWP